MNDREPQGTAAAEVVALALAIIDKETAAWAISQRSQGPPRRDTAGNQNSDESS